MATRLQCHIGSCAGSSGAGCAQRVDFRMGLARALMPSLADDFLALRNDATDPWIWMGRLETALGELERASHRSAIKVGEHGWPASLVRLLR